MDRLASVAFKSLLRQIVATSPRFYSNRKGVIQSSVGMIFRLPEGVKVRCIDDILDGQFQTVELLFAQRAGYQKDRNAYNIVFPGGQCDGQETDLEACKRELFQQIGLKVAIMKRFRFLLYDFRLTSSAFIQDNCQKRGSKVYITCHLWCLKPQESHWQPLLNIEELRETRWLPYHLLIDPKRYVTSDALKLGLIQRLPLPLPLVNSINQNLVEVSLPELQLGMDRNLWGLTLWIWSYTLQMARRNLLEHKLSQTDLPSSSQRDLLLALNLEISHVKKMEIKFKDWYPLKWPAIAGIRIWHNLNRVRPFTYERKSERKAKIMLLAVVLGLVVFYSLLSSDLFFI